MLLHYHSYISTWSHYYIAVILYTEDCKGILIKLICINKAEFSLVQLYANKTGSFNSVYVHVS